MPIRLLPVNIRAKFVLQKMILCTQPDGWTGLYSPNPSHIYSFCQQYNISDPQLIEEKVLAVFAALSNRNVEIRENKNQKKPQVQQEMVQ